MYLPVSRCHQSVLLYGPRLYIIPAPLYLPPRMPINHNCANKLEEIMPSRLNLTRTQLVSNQTLWMVIINRYPYPVVLLWTNTANTLPINSSSNHLYPLILSRIPPPQLQMKICSSYYQMSLNRSHLMMIIMIWVRSCHWTMCQKTLWIHWALFSKERKLLMYRCDSTF